MLYISYGFAQEKKELEPKKLLKDFEYFEKIIEAHPDPYTHISEIDFKSKLREVKSSLSAPHTTLEFYKKIASIMALIKDGHSSIALPRYWMDQQREDNGAFPYEMYLTNDDELYIIKSFDENASIPLGAKIISINGVGVKDFLDIIDPYIAYETKNFRNTKIDRNFEQYLYIAFGRSDKIDLEFFTSQTSHVLSRNMDYKLWRKFQKNNQAEREAMIEAGEPYSYKNIGNGVGLLHIYSFSVRNLLGYESFLRKTFKTIRNDSIHSLIIDLRGNFGGWPKISSRLFHYVSNSHFKTMAKSEMKVSYPYRNNLLNRNPRLRSGDRSYIRQERHFINVEAIINEKVGTIVNESIFFNEEPSIEDYEFQGDCYLLINRDSYSAASSFASTFQCYQMGVIIGEETGGTKIFRANAIYETLNRSRLRVRISTTKKYATCYDQEFEGVKPDIGFTPSVIDLIS